MILQFIFFYNQAPVSNAMLHYRVVTSPYKLVPIFVACWLIKINEREKEKTAF